MEGRATRPRLWPASRHATGRHGRLLVSLVLAAWIALPAAPAAAFGTIDGGGQHREHERLTRAALSCAGSARSEQDCFAARSMDQLAGRGKGFGAIGAPDKVILDSDCRPGSDERRAKFGVIAERQAARAHRQAMASAARILR